MNTNDIEILIQFAKKMIEIWWPVIAGTTIIMLLVFRNTSRID